MARTRLATEPAAADIEREAIVRDGDFEHPSHSAMIEPYATANIPIVSGTIGDFALVALEKKHAAREQEILDQQNEALKVTREARERQDPRHALVASALESQDEGEEIDATRGEDMYGKPGSFSSFRVGPFSGKTRVRPGETRVTAGQRLRAEFAQLAAEEYAIRLPEFLANWVKVAKSA